MKKINIVLLTSTVIVSTHVNAGWLDFLTSGTETATETVEQTNSTVDTLNKTVQAVESTQQTAQQLSLVDSLVKQLGVSQAQAEGGSGALFQVAKQSMTDTAFNQVSQSVPGMDGLLAAAPKPQPQSQTANLLTGLANATGNSTLSSAANLVNQFQQLDMSKGMVSQFTPVVVDYVKKNGGEMTANLLQTALAGL